VNPETVLGLLSILGIGGFTASAWLATGRSDQPGRRPFVWLQVLLGATLGCLGLILFDQIPAQLSDVSLAVGMPVSFGLWGVFGIAYTGRGPLVTRTRTVLFGGIVTLAVAFSLLIPFLDGILMTVVMVTATLSWTLLFCYCLYGSFLLVWSVLADDELPAGGGGLLASCGVVLAVLPLASGLAPTLFIPLHSGGIVLLSAGFLTIQLRYRPFQGPPAMGHLARDSVFDAMSDAVMVVDRERRVADANTVAERTFGVQLPDAVGRPIDDVIEYDPDDQGGETTDPVSIGTTIGQRTFTVTSSRLEDEDGDRIGCAYVFRDVTDERTREQQLAVLNRVLRHNLRNDLDAIRGFAETLGETAEDEGIDTETVADRIRCLSRELSETGATVERAKQLRTRETLARDPTDVDTLLRSLAAELRQNYPHSRISVSPTGSPLRTDEAVLETVLREVVENAIEHNDGTEPSVEISADPTDEGVDFVVRDDGAGIPDREREVLLEGEPTQLRHSTGIGLWLVSWGVTRLGGELAFGDADTGGTVVTLSIPDREPATTDRGSPNRPEPTPTSEVADPDVSTGHTT
jgi:PAS domain S-box-containing protein